MCGIAGIISRKGTANGYAALQEATRRLRHRGPQAERFWQSPGGKAAFGHCRLCIIDLTEAAAQPMAAASRYTLVFNGEIYNYKELRTQLQQVGRRFRSQSDTEVLLEAYAQWGPDCVQKFDGAFAFALWDEAEQTLFAARDRVGEKPFFFSYGDERLVFASELKALWPLGVAKTVNRSMLYNFLTIGYSANPTDPSETFFEGVLKLPAAHSLTYRAADDHLEWQRYWQPSIAVNESITDDEAISSFRQQLADSVVKRLRSDVPVGTSLSGGLDSSAIVAFCQESGADAYTHHCFTASFEGFEKDETAYAEKVAKQFGLTHHRVTITEADVPALMDAVAAAQDEPFLSASALAQYKVFAAARAEGITVLLDGQGADETLGGYHKYYKWHWQALYRQRQLGSGGEEQAARQLGISEPFGWAHKLLALLPEFGGAILQTQKSRRAYRQPALHRDFAFAQKRNLYYSLPAEQTLNGALFYNSFVNGLEDLLRYADRNSMAHGVELRLPFLQHELLAFLFTLPPRFKIRQGWTKWLLRDAVKEKLPSEIVWRTDKVGYEPPQQAWMQLPTVQKKIKDAKALLVKEEILAPHVLQQAVIPTAAHAAESLDWRYWSATALFS